MALASALSRLPPPRTAAAPRALGVQCRVARPSAVLDRPAAAEPSSSADASPTQSGDRPPRRRRAPRRRSSPPPPRSAAAASDDEETSDDNDQEQTRQEGPTFTPVESAASLILRGLRQPALVADGEGEGDKAEGESGEGSSNDPPTVPLAVEATQGLAVAVLALSRAQHALKTERGLELVISSPSTRRGRGPRGNTSLRARLRAAPAQAPTDRPVRRVDVVPGTSRNSVVAAAVDALRAAHPAPVDLIARGPRAASNALAALGLVRATLLSGAASFTPAAPPPWVVKRGGGGGHEADDDSASAAETAAPAAAAPRPLPAFAPLDVSAVLDALPPARPAAAALAAGDATQLPPHELVVRLRLTTGPPPPPREDRDRDRGERQTGERRRRPVAAAVDDAPDAANGGEEAVADGDDADDTASRRPRRSRSATRREKASAVAELRAAAAAATDGGGAETASLRRELAELGERVRDLAKMNAVVLDLLEKEKRRGA
jgi:ribonuclease E